MVTASSARLHGGNVWAVARAHGWPVEQIVDFSADVNPRGFPDEVRTIVHNSVEAIRHYPDPDALAFRRAVAAAHGVPLEWCWPGNGSAELISWVVRARPVRAVVVVAPTFVEYGWAAEQAGAEVRTVALDPDRGFPLDLDDPSWRAALAGADVVFLGNPNNPTGTLTSRETLRALAARCGEQGAWLVVDEAFLEFLEPSAQPSLLPELARWPHVWVLRSLTKLFAVPGLRMGYVVAAPALVERLRAVQPAWPLNTFAAAVGPALLAQTEFAAATRAFVRAQRAALAEALERLPGMRPLPSAANFLLCRLAPPAPSSAVFQERLAAQGLLVRTDEGFDGLVPGHYLRLAVRGPQDQARLVRALQAVLRDAG